MKQRSKCKRPNEIRGDKPWTKINLTTHDWEGSTLLYSSIKHCITLQPSKFLYPLYFRLATKLAKAHQCVLL